MTVGYFPDNTRSSVGDFFVSGQKWQDQGASILLAPILNIQYLEELFIFRNLKDVREFLEEYPFLIPIAAEAYVQIKKFFPDAYLYLELCTDQESTHGISLAVILIATHHSAEDAIAILDQFDDDWWLDAMPTTEGKLSINLEFI